MQAGPANGASRGLPGLVSTVARESGREPVAAADLSLYPAKIGVLSRFPSPRSGEQPSNLSRNFAPCDKIVGIARESQRCTLQGTLRARVK